MKKKVIFVALVFFMIAVFAGTTSAEQDWIEVGEYKFGSSNRVYPEERYITLDKSYIGSGENIILLENANPKWSGYWFVWDYLKLEVSGQSVWELGENEAPPDYSEKAHDTAPYFNLRIKVKPAKSITPKNTPYLIRGGIIIAVIIILAIARFKRKKPSETNYQDH